MFSVHHFDSISVLSNWKKPRRNNAQASQPIEGKQVQKLNPKKAADNPLAATLLGAVLLKASRESGDPYQAEAGQKLIQIAQDNQDKMPRLNPNCELALAVKRARKLE